MNKTIGIIIGILVAAIIVLAALGVFKSESRESLETEIVAFAECLGEQGATFYGAFWCPHCQNQKRIFGRKGSDALPYVECSTPDSQGQTQECIDAGIQSYPTWEFPDGTRQTGTQSIQALAAATNCPISPELQVFFDISEENQEPTADETAGTVEILDISAEVAQ